MIRLSKILLYFTAAFLLAWLLPWFYNFLTTRPNNTPFTLYSCITQNFASIEVHQGQYHTTRRKRQDLYGQGVRQHTAPVLLSSADGRRPQSRHAVWKSVDTTVGFDAKFHLPPQPVGYQQGKAETLPVTGIHVGKSRSGDAGRRLQNRQPHRVHRHGDKPSKRVEKRTFYPVVDRQGFSVSGPIRTGQSDRTKRVRRGVHADRQQGRTVSISSR